MMNCPADDNPYGICITKIGEAEINTVHTGFIGDCMSLSPDGEFYVMQGSQVLNILGAEAGKWPPRPLVNIPRKYPANNLACLSMWSPDGKSVTFEYGGGYQGSIEKTIFYNLRMDGSGLRITAELDGRSSPPKQSPDRSKFYVWLDPSDSVFPRLVVLSVKGEILLSVEIRGVIEDKDNPNFAGPDPKDICQEWSSASEQIILKYKE
jgi:hypothetical protein